MNASQLQVLVSMYMEYFLHLRMIIILNKYISLKAFLNSCYNMENYNEQKEAEDKVVADIASR